ncbi:stimulator of interferon genes protein [Chelonus insularis]|uniref:stimulator of interferon genes protein n=1 Tax=Chelonus insularis TaxID=460826 RepID=UPI00158BF7B5|nr:stimulator of interferon genes protein [Chelonus insularis]
MNYTNLLTTNESKDDDIHLINKDDRTYDDVPKQSSSLLYYLFLSILLIIIAAICIRLVYRDSYWKAIIHIWTVFVIFILTLATGSFVSRIVNCLAELEHLNTKYDGQLYAILKVTFDFNLTSIIIIVLCCCSIANQFKSINNYIEYFNLSNLLISIAAIILCYNVDLFGSKSTTFRTIDALGGVDYGTGMAYSYFYGYLRIILPPDGLQNPGIRTKMVDYESHHNVKIPVKKLFILIPKSGHIPPDLKDASDNWLEGTTSLTNVIRDRAGIKRRSYKNTVYKIHPEGEDSNHRPVYITVEGATPMLTLNEIIKHSHKQTEIYRHSHKEIVAVFYKTLQELLNSDPDCRDVCELIYYDDYPNNEKINIGKLLLYKIRKKAPASY